MIRKQVQPKERLGRGTRHDKEVVGICVRFDEDQFDAIRARALKAGHSFAAEVRALCDKGLA